MVVCKGHMALLYDFGIGRDAQVFRIENGETKDGFLWMERY